MYALSFLISFFFRLVLIGYATLICLSQTNFLPSWVYAISILIYLTIFFYCKKSNTEFNSTVRLLNDYFFIITFLYGKSPNFLNLCFILLPVVNSSNYTGKYGIIASIRLYVVAIAIIYIFYDFKFDSTWVIPIIAFWTLSLVSKGREYFKRLELILSNPVSQIDINQSSPYSTNKRQILKEIINQFNENRFLGILHPVIKDVICFKIKDENVSIISSSRFVKKFNLTNKELLLNYENIQKNSFSKLDIFIDDIEKKADIRFFSLSKMPLNTYLYYVEFQDAPATFLPHYINRIFSFTFGNLSKVFEIENEIKQRRLKVIRDLKKQALYIEQSTHNMHFINNKLSPILEYFTLQSDIRSGEVKTNSSIDKVFDALELRSKRNIQMISRRSVKQLDRNANPFFNHAPESVSIEQLRSSISSTWAESGLNPDKLIIIVDDEPALAKQVTMQADYFEIVIDEIIENIIKHSFSVYNASLVIMAKHVVLRFANDLDAAQVEKLRMISSQFNSDQVSEMLKRTSHGMAMVKAYLLHLGIRSSIAIDGSNYTLTLVVNINEA